MASSNEKSRCRYRDRICTNAALPNYQYCSMHILEDADAPYQQCTYVCQMTGLRCLTPVPAGDHPAHCAKSKGKRNSTLCKWHAIGSSDSAAISNSSVLTTVDCFDDSKLLYPTAFGADSKLSETDASISAHRGRPRKKLTETPEESAAFGLSDLAAQSQESDPREIDISLFGKHKLGAAADFDMLCNTRPFGESSAAAAMHPFANISRPSIANSANPTVSGLPVRALAELPSLSTAFSALSDDVVVTEEELIKLICEKTVMLRKLYANQLRRYLLALRNAKRDQIAERTRIEQDDFAEHNRRLERHAQRFPVPRRNRHEQPSSSSTSRAPAQQTDELNSNEPESNPAPTKPADADPTTIVKPSDGDAEANAQDADQSDEPSGSSLIDIRRRASCQVKMELIRSLKHYGSAKLTSRTSALLAYRADRLRYARAVRMQRERTALDQTLNVKKKRKSLATDASQAAMTKWKERFNQSGVHQCAAVYEDLDNAVCGDRSMPFSRFCFKHILLDPEQVLFKKCEVEDCCVPAIAMQKCCRTHFSQKFIENAAQLNS